MKKLLVLRIFGVLCFFTVTILAQVPQLMNYQGRLTDNAGVPISTATTLIFSLYQGGDAFTAGSGLLVYEEDVSVTPDSNGVFSHLVGSGTVIYGTLDSTVFQTSSPVYLEITIDPAGANETLLPREQIVTVGYSFKSELAEDADTVDGQDAAAFAPMVHNHDPDYVNEGQANSVTTSMIVNGTIVDADINASANIAASKINTSGLNADLLDGVDSTGFVSTSGDDMTGTLMITAAGTYALYGKNTISGMATTYGVYGQSYSQGGFGVYGQAPFYGVYGYAPEGGSNSGVGGKSDSTVGCGVSGYASASNGTTYGVYGGSDSTSGTGVRGYASASSGTTYGVSGQSDSSGGYGVYGKASASDGTGVYGYNSSTGGNAFGIYGRSDSESGFAVHGYTSASSGINYAVYGRSDSTSGFGVFGYAKADSGTNYGVHGRSMSTNGRGVYGRAYASSGTTFGVYGESDSPSGYGVYGKAPAGGYAGYFWGNVHVKGQFTTSGSKPCVQPIDNGKKVLLYAMESPEIWFEDFGSGQLVNGRAVVPIEKVFAQTANIEMGYLVFLTPTGECQGLYIARQDKDSFEVRELGGGTSNISFYYRIVAKRRGYEQVRFEEFSEPEQPSEEANLPMERK